MEEKYSMICNACGREIKVLNGVLKEDVFEAVKEWGYFSHKDLEVHRFNICEECYDRITSEFVKPVSVSQKTEVLGSIAHISFRGNVNPC